MKGIEWCDKTWSPLTGCNDCEVKHCRALGTAWRHAHNPKLPDETREKYARVVTKECDWCDGNGEHFVGTAAGDVLESCPGCNTTGHGPLHWTGHIEYFPKRLKQPLGWKSPKRIAVGLMGDMFAEGVDFDFLEDVFSVIRRAHQHTFIMLTKRPLTMLDYFTINDMPPNLIKGVSITDQATADERIPPLLQIPGRHCVSIEPMYGPVDLEKSADRLTMLGFRHSYHPADPSGLGNGPRVPRETLGTIEEVYLGGATGKDAPPLHPDWVRKVRDDCQAAGVKFVFKNWGEWRPLSELLVDVPFGNKVPKEFLEHKFQDGTFCWRVGRARAGRTLDGRTWDGSTSVD